LAHRQTLKRHTLGRLGEEMVPWEIEGVKEVLDLCNPARGGVVDNEFVSEVLGFIRNKEGE
jgi:hypothetical protein